MWPSLVKIQYTELKLSCRNDPETHLFELQNSYKFFAKQEISSMFITFPNIHVIDISTATYLTDKNVIIAKLIEIHILSLLN